MLIQGLTLIKISYLILSYILYIYIYIYFRAKHSLVNNNKPCGVVQYDLTDYEDDFIEIITIEVQKSFHINLTVVKFDSIYTGSLDLHCRSYSLLISAFVTNSNTHDTIQVCVGEAASTRIIYSHKVKCKYTNLVVDSKMNIAFLYQVASLSSSFVHVLPDLMLAQSRFQEFALNMAANLHSFHQQFMLTKLMIGGIYEKQIYINTYVNRHCTDPTAATKLFDGPRLKYDVTLCKMNSSLVSRDMVQLLSYLGTYFIVISYLEDTSYTNVHYLIEYKIQRFEAIDVKLALQERYILNINTKHTDIYHKQWFIKSPYSIKLTMLENRRFVGYTRACSFGGLYLKEITAYKYVRAFGPFCTSDFGIPLMDRKSWYIGQRSARLTIWAFRGFFDMDIEIAIELTKCEGINDVYSYIPCR